MEPLETRPRTVALVALGPSKADYLHATCCKKDFLTTDETWVVNSLAGAVKADKIFLMDDLRDTESRYPDWSRKLKLLETPLVTCKHYEDWPNSIEYPIDAVTKRFQDDWFSNTVAYAVAYAALIEVADLYLFGCDFHYPGSQSIEPGADCVAYWLGRAREGGMKYKIPSSSTLMDSHTGKSVDGKLCRPMYGYDYNPGRMQERVERGRGSDSDKAFAAKAPSVLDTPLIDVSNAGG